MQKLLERTTTTIQERWLVDSTSADANPSPQAELGDAALDEGAHAAPAAPQAAPEAAPSSSKTVAIETEPEPESNPHAREQDDCECVPVRRRSRG